MATLAEEDAFTIATTWRAQLRGCVCLDAEPSLPATILQTCEWVTFKLDSARAIAVADPDPTTAFTFNRKRFAYARATTLAWFALSCCDGYSSMENPQFWKRILSRWDDATLAWVDPPPVPVAVDEQPPPRPADAPLGDLEANLRGTFRRQAIQRASRPKTHHVRGVRFFPDAKKPFPRIQLKQGDQAADGVCERILLGLVAFPDEARDRELQSILTRLTPFIRARQWTRRVPVSLDVPDLMNVSIVLAGVSAPSKIVVEPGSPLDFPQLQVAAIMADRWASSSSLFQLEKQLLPCEVDITITTADLHQLIQDETFLQSAVNRPPRRRATRNSPQWRVSCVRVDMESTSHVALLCSALPHITTIRSLELTYKDDGKSKTSAQANNWAWLGYAIFHPDAASQSTLESIDLDIRGVSQTDLAAFESMAVGNNIPAQRRAKIVSHEYVEGFVGPDSEVWSLPGLAEAKLQSRISDSWVSICVPSAQEFDWDQEWVCVVNPGFGFGWLQSSDIIEIRSRPPGKPCLRGLRISRVEVLGVESIQSRDLSRLLTLGVNFESQHRRDEKVKRLLSVLGGRLEALDLKDSKHLTSSTLQDVLVRCPSLSRLCVGHNGSLWENPDGDRARAWSRFEELELKVKIPEAHGFSDAMQALKVDTNLESLWKMRSPHPTRLPHLKALRMNVTYGEHFINHKDALVAFFAGQKRLEFFNWSRARPRSIHTADRVIDAAQHEFERDIQEQRLGFAFVPVRLAFLSVIYGDKFASLDFKEDLAALIFEFAVSPIQREVHIDL